VQSASSYGTKMYFATTNLFATGAQSRMMIDSQGNVGIGTNAPTAKLSVNGAANNTTGTWGVFSDSRSKENVTEYTRGLSDLMKLNPVTFSYKAEFGIGTSTHIGFIAQDLQVVAPEMVTNLGTVNGVDNFLENNQEGLNQMMVNSVQEQQISINGLAGMLQTLENASSSIEILDVIKNEASINAYDYVLARFNTAKTLINDFAAARVTAIRGYFDKVFTRELCMKDSLGQDVCINGDDLKKIKEGINTINTVTPPVEPPVQTPVVVPVCVLPEILNTTANTCETPAVSAP
jgi:Chaperone of endosialidase